MDQPAEHLSSSRVQTDAEIEIVQALGQARGTVLQRKPEKIHLAGGVNVEVDAASSDGRTVVEAYARQGALHGAQLKKIAQDILKLALIKKEPGKESTEAIIAFASQEARDSIRGWVQQAAEAFGVELTVVTISPQLRDAILAVQKRQVMVNLDYVADDVGDISEGP